MDLDPKDAMLGYKFDIEAKKSIIHLRPDDPVAFSSMLEKVKSRIVRSRHRAVILEIHNLVYPISSAYIPVLINMLVGYQMDPIPDHC